MKTTKIYLQEFKGTQKNSGRFKTIEGNSK